MKNLLVLTSLFLLNIQVISQPHIYRFEGHITNHSLITDTLYVCKIKHILDFYSGNSGLIIKKIPLINGTFSFYLNSDSIESGVIRLNIQSRNISNGAAVQRGGSAENCWFLVLENDNSIRLKADALDFTGTFEAFPSGTNKSLRELRNILSGRIRLADSISTLLSKSTKELSNVDQLKTAYYERLLADRPAIQAFVDTVKNVYCKLIALHQLDIPYSLNDSIIYKYCTSLLIHLSSQMEDAYLLNSFKQLLKSYDKESYTSNNLLKARFKNRLGETVEINLKKRLTLIDFWASWCIPCREANKSELQIINDLSKTQDFEIISISLDQQFERWLDASIKDKISWRNYFDPSNFQSEYITDLQIRDLPSSFLIDVSGQVIARDIALPELIKLLK